MVNIVSYNVNGLRDFKKRKKVFYHLRQVHRADIVLLQETHCTQAEELLWQNQWGGQIINSCGESNARGVALLIGKNVDCEVLHTHSDDQGRVVLAEVKLADKEVILAGIYAPNSDKPRFFENVFQQIEALNNPNIILCGDFNLIFDIELDRAGSSDYNHKNSMQLLKSFMDKLELWDIWRVRNPVRPGYTWHRRNSSSFSRIDFFLVSSGLVQCVKDIAVKPSYNSDHSILLLDCDFSDVARGKGFWKLNVSLLNDQDHNELVRQAIQGALFRYRQEDPALKWELIKMEMAQASLTFAKQKALQRHKKLKDLQESIGWYTIQLEVDPQGEQERIETILHEKQFEYDQLLESKFRSAVFHSKSNWYEKGERSSKYFFNLEKARFNNRNMKQVFDVQGQLHSHPKEILDIQAAFFAKLYSKDQHVFFDLGSSPDKSISSQQARDLEQDLTLQEITQALAGLNDNKTPGTDGIPCEAYKVFWELL